MFVHVQSQAGATEEKWNNLLQTLNATRARVTDRLPDAYAFLKRHPRVTSVIKHATNASLKLWELLHHFDITFAHVFCNAELPGAFIWTLDAWAQKKKFEWSWVANSLQVNQGGLGDPWRMIDQFPDRWLMHRDGHSGNVTDVNVIAALSTVEKVDFYTSDAGQDITGHWDLEEELHLTLHVGQVVVGWHVLKPGGTMIVKQFTWCLPGTRALLDAIVASFESVHICKPLTSRASNSETYVVARGYKGYESHSAVVELFTSWLANGSDLNEFNSNGWHDLALAFAKKQMDAIDRPVLEKGHRWLEMI